jgi:putative transposase
MGYRRVPFAIGEWYHCFSRGIDKRIVFVDRDDFRRFQQLLYLANDIAPINRDNFYHRSHDEMFRVPHSKQLVAVGGYCLMRNHPHLLLQELVEGGISKYMHKVGTGYAMYFNVKNQRIGNLMVKPFRSKHVDDDVYLRHVVQYIHLNPAEVFEHGWKKGIVKNDRHLEEKLREYEFSSMMDYFGEMRAERAILDRKAMEMISDGMPPLRTIIRESQAYYEEMEKEYGIVKYPPTKL